MVRRGVGQGVIAAGTDGLCDMTRVLTVILVAVPLLFVKAQAYPVNYLKSVDWSFLARDWRNSAYSTELLWSLGPLSRGGMIQLP